MVFTKVASTFGAALLLGTVGLMAPAGHGQASSTDPFAFLAIGFHVWPDLQPGASVLGGVVESTIPPLRAAAVRAPDLPALERAARADPNVRYVEHDSKRAATPPYAPKEPYWPQQWGPQSMGASRAWDATRGNTNLLVAMVDTGLFTSHEEFQEKERFAPGYDFARNDGTPEDECDHGTGGTSVLAGSMYNGKGVAGMAQVKIVPFKIYGNWDGSGCTGSYFDTARAITYAADAGIPLQSIQWQGRAPFQTLNESVRYAYDKGSILVGSAGNWGQGCSPSCVTQAWRENAERVIVVGALANANGTASFSSRGPEVDVTAPGENIAMASGYYMDGYKFSGGTSFSTPQVAGVVALMLASNPTATREQITRRLLETATDLGPAGHDPTYGHGRVNAGLAVAGWPGAFDAQHTHAGGNEWWVQVHVDANHPVKSVSARLADGSTWIPLVLQPWGRWAASFNVPAGRLVQFRTTSEQGAADLSSCYVWPAGDRTACPGDGGTKPVAFQHKGGNEWWVEALVTPTPVSVQAMDTGGPWVGLEKKSWGNWAGSFHIEPGNQVRFRATFANGTSLESCWFTHPAGAPQCQPIVTPNTTFAHKGGNEWWVEARVDPKPSAVWARDTNGVWVALSLKSWGNWAGSFHIEPGHQAQFRAAYPDGRQVESCWFTHPAGACADATPPPPFEAAFSGVRGNEGWVETNVAVQGGALARVEARVNAGAWTALEPQTWGSWAKGMSAPRGSVVEFRAVATDGRSDLSDRYPWPPA